MGAMTEDSGRERKRNTVYKPSATFPQGREEEWGWGVGSVSPPSSSPSMIVICLLARVFIRSCFLLPVHTQSFFSFFKISLHFCLSLSQDRIFKYATVLPTLYLFSRSRFIVAERRLGAGDLKKEKEKRKAEEGQN